MTSSTLHEEQVIGQPAVPVETPPSPKPVVPIPPKPSQVVQPQLVVPPPEQVSSQSYLPPPESTIDLDGSFLWASSYLDDQDFRAVPVSCFKHVRCCLCPFFSLSLFSQLLWRSKYGMEKERDSVYPVLFLEKNFKTREIAV